VTQIQVYSSVIGLSDQSFIMLCHPLFLENGDIKSKFVSISVCPRPST